ncbi:hypothetical protein T492DRAFT_840956 [Pavlovales sp. CCMP2436]|nr:hypothetical protein T492DRAFT_840956 [Pavlovales sp. CCMP2436]
MDVDKGATNRHQHDFCITDAVRLGCLHNPWHVTVDAVRLGQARKWSANDASNRRGIIQCQIRLEVWDGIFKPLGALAAQVRQLQWAHTTAEGTLPADLLDEGGHDGLVQHGGAVGYVLDLDVRLQRRAGEHLGQVGAVRVFSSLFDREEQGVDKFNFRGGDAKAGGSGDLYRRAHVGGEVVLQEPGHICISIPAQHLRAVQPTEEVGGDFEEGGEDNESNAEKGEGEGSSGEDEDE